ncbi:MAG: CHAT domain-containing protein [Acidobacteriota bacterium]|nr:CHAT domain-containing protein [Acidobacteriota bacterium]
MTARLAGSEVHAYSIGVPAGQLLHAVVEQKGVDVVVTLRNGRGAMLLAVDSPNRDWGPEEFWWIAPENGIWRLEVRPLRPASQGLYRLWVVSVGRPGFSDLSRVEARQETERAERLRAAGDAAAARRHLAVARELWRRNGELTQQTLGDLRLAEAAADVGDSTGEIAAYRSAVAGYRGIGDPRQETYSELRLGDALRRVGDLEGAWQAQAAALNLARLHGLPADEAAALNNLALILEARGETRAALERYRLALSIFRRLGARAQVAAVLHNLGVRLSLLGLLEPAEKDLAEASSLRRALGEVQALGATLTELGWVYRLQALAGGGESLRIRSRAILEQALACRRAAQDSAGAAGTLDRLGTVFRDDRRWDEALSSYQQSLAIVLREPPGPNLAHGLNNLSELWLDRRHFARARRLATHALARFMALPVRDPHGEAHAHFLLGRAAAGLGDLNGARSELEQALGAVEALRSGLGDDTLTLPFFALRQLYFEGAIGTLMDLDVRQPGRGFAAAALLTSERARMRSLIDGIVERERRDGGRGHAEDAQPPAPPLSIDRIKNELLDSDTLLLEFNLDEERGFLWIVSRAGLAVYPLPGRRVLEPLVRRVYKCIGRSIDDCAAARRLADLLLGGVTDRREVKRLAVVTDGLLAYVPFAALPWGVARHPLGERYEIVRLPSATTVLALRRRRTGNPPDKGPVVVVLADPVFSASDPRVRRDDKAQSSIEPADREALTRTVGDLSLDGLERLPATRREAAAIQAQAPGALVILDFAARREVFDTAAVRHAQLLHLATHSLVHPVDPALSGIVLSLVDDQGRPRPGFLQASEIAGLDLEASLVVLSACKTALGPETKGEGLMGLARAFLHAGARRVIVSLWNVEDESSATLMTHFYEGLLRHELTPTAALRRAQLAMRADPSTANPSNWAGFELQGDWR